MKRRLDPWMLAVYGLLIAVAATVPVWTYSRPWGDHPSELIALALIIVLLRILVFSAPSPPE